MAARALLVRGLLAGLIAGLITFAVAHQVGEPPVEQAIALEGVATTDTHSHDGAASHSHSHGTESEGEELVTRAVQRTAGLSLATVLVGVALGGLVALAAAYAVGRLGTLTPAQSTGAVSLVGFVSFALVPFWKYPANPPAVGSGETIGERTVAHFGFVGVSVVVAGLAVVLAVRLATAPGLQLSGYAASVLASVAYLVVVVGAGSLMPSAVDVDGFPAATLWEFRTASLLVLGTLWAVLGVVLTGLVGRLAAGARRDSARRELAAAL